jgi:hypothetical protein
MIFELMEKFDIFDIVEKTKGLVNDVTKNAMNVADILNLEKFWYDCHILNLVVQAGLNCDKMQAVLEKMKT